MKRKSGEGKVPRHERLAHDRLERLRLVSGDLVLDGHMQSRQMIVLLRQKPVEMIGNFIAQHQHGRAVDPERGPAAKIHDCCQTRTRRRMLPGKARQQGARFIKHMVRQSVKQRDVCAQVIAFDREVRAAQTIGP